jgi:hypothetical protein
MYVSKSMTFPTPLIGHSRHGLFFTRLDCQSNAKPSEKDNDLPGTFRVAVNIPNNLGRLHMDCYNLSDYTRILKIIICVTKSRWPPTNNFVLIDQLS